MMKPSIQTTILMALFSCAALAQTQADPYKPTNTTTTTTTETATGKDASHEDSPKTLSTCIEVFSLPMATAAAAQRENISNEELYKRLIAQLADGSVKQEMLMVHSSPSGAKVSNESVVEEIYPTEYTMTGAPNELTHGSDSGGKESKPVESIKNFYPPALPTSYEMRKTGNTFEIELTPSENGHLCNIRMVLEQVLLVGKSVHGTGANTYEMPVFEIRRMFFFSDVTIGKPFLAGTLNRPVNSKIDPNAADTVSFAFITIKLCH